MTAKDSYINPQVVQAAMEALKTYKAKHPDSLLPLYGATNCGRADARTREVFVRAAKRLKWKVVVSRGHVYENGQFIW